MEKIISILVVADRSNADLPLLKKAVELARAFGAKLELFTCDADRSVDFRRAYDTAGVEKEWLACVMEGCDYLETLRESAAAPDVSILIDAMADSRLTEAIVKKVDACHPDLVMKSAARAHPARRFTLDSTDWELMRACPVQLMLVRGKEWNAKARFAAMVDVSVEEMAAAASVAQTADYLARSCGGELDAVYSERNDSGRGLGLRVGALDRLAGEYGIDPQRVHILSGEPDDTLPAFAANQGYDLIILGAMSHSKSLTTLVGRLTGRFVEALHCDFLFVKPAPTVVVTEAGSSSRAAEGAIPIKAVAMNCQPEA